ncbi:pseudouridine synthase [Motilimonas cestriensis]|uniref:Ribosomal small subunit pseudouridine synthase A n=1 Tax=Motilimonas cestriensis TaxID=2742685 RepID=A0ABS8W915_9GAMM|nr:pseudouridine synthase [Motilimonas cestriensis]MCE2594842.1 pseudouridine synthase [Motilimonas cestriensis]
MRLDKFVCKSTALSREEATQVIVAGQVKVNGSQVIQPNAQVHEDNDILLNGQLLQPRPFRYLMLHKPAGSICSNLDERYPSIFSQINLTNSSELHIAGRLDADTTGLVLATDDGRWSFNITRPTQQCYKVYRVGLSQPLTKVAAGRLTDGVQLQGVADLTLPAKIELLSSTEVKISITEGKFHQVKRMFAAVGNRVVSLHREQIGGISLDVPVGQWRDLTNEEVSLFASASELGIQE